jgi:hypothetical protein
MDSMTVQASLWIAAGAILVLYMKRRRNRKMVP